MSYITVRQALELPELHNLEVLAGEEGLDRVLKNVTVLEVPDPVYWVKEGDLLLTTFYGVREDHNAQVHLVERVADLSVAGICFHPGIETSLAHRVLDMANARNLPILKMPRDMPYARVISAVLRTILNRQAYVLARSTEINSLLTQTILNGAEAGEIVSTLAKLLKSPVALLDASLNLVSEDPYSEIGRDLFAEGIPELIKCGALRGKNREIWDAPIFKSLHMDGREVRVGIMAVMANGKVYGYLTAWGCLKRFEDVDIYAIAHASTAIALDSMRQISLAGYA